jgi:hypothetical protein
LYALSRLRRVFALAGFFLTIAVVSTWHRAGFAPFLEKARRWVFRLFFDAAD